MSNICQLPSDTVRLLSSSQIITSVSSAVKELVENSLDAGAKNIQVKLENFGFDMIEVKDDGHGVSYDNVQKMFLPGCTSKIGDFKDLGTLKSFGFRGEALSALCQLGNVTVTTITSQDSLAMSYTINHDGVPVASKAHYITKGTIVSVTNLFASLPVRKQYLASKKRAGDELKKVEHTVQALSVLNLDLRLQLIHNKCCIWQKNCVGALKQAVMQVYGLKAVSKMAHVNRNQDGVDVELLVPKTDIDDVDAVSLSAAHTPFVHVNKRPVQLKEVSKLVCQHIAGYLKEKTTNKSLLYLVSIQVEPEYLDVNLEPNKTRVLLRNISTVLNVIDTSLAEYYGQPCMMEHVPDQDEEEPQVKRSRLDISLEDNPTQDSFSLDSELSSPTNTICSQINKVNCVLATEMEVKQLNTMLTQTDKLVTKVVVESPKEQKEVAPGWPFVKTNETTNMGAVERNECEPVALPSNQTHGASAWSKGHWTTDRDGVLVGGAVLALPPAIPQVLDTRTDELNKDLAEFDLSAQSVSSQMGKKELSAFTKFTRLMRPKILEEYPNLLFTKVAALLVERWRDLSQDEKKYYEQLSKVVKEERNEHQANKPVEKNHPEEKNRLKKLLVKIKEKATKKRPERKETGISVTLKKVGSLLKTCSVYEERGGMMLIGQLIPSGSWLYKEKNVIGHLRHVGLQEVVLFNRMMASHCVPLTKLDKPIVLTEDVLGELWPVLLSLERQLDVVSQRFIVSSDAVVKNGFQVEMNAQEDNVTSCLLTHITQVLPHYGVAELRNSLHVYHTCGELGGLASWRPTALRNYIMNEAIRISHDSGRTSDKVLVEELVETWQLCLQHLPPECLHNKKLFVPFYTLPTTN